MFEYNFLYKIMYEMTTVFESSTNPNELILGLKQVFKSFSSATDINIFTYEENTQTFKNFAKPWENLTDEKEIEKLKNIHKKLDGKNHTKEENYTYFPLYSNLSAVPGDFSIILVRTEFNTVIFL